MWLACLLDNLRKNSPNQKRSPDYSSKFMTVGFAPSRDQYLLCPLSKYTQASKFLISAEKDDDFV